LVARSTKGLTAKIISDLLKTPCHPVLTRMHGSGQLDRINSPRGYVYLSNSKKIGKVQKMKLSEHEQHPLPSDADSVIILVNLIKKPELSAEDLAEILTGNTSINSIKKFIQHHDLEKKTLIR
jgi:hypothetical protein